MLQSLAPQTVVLLEGDGTFGQGATEVRSGQRLPLKGILRPQPLLLLPIHHEVSSFAAPCFLPQGQRALGCGEAKG